MTFNLINVIAHYLNPLVNTGPCMTNTQHYFLIFLIIHL